MKVYISYNYRATLPVKAELVAAWESEVEEIAALGRDEASALQALAAKIGVSGDDLVIA